MTKKKSLIFVNNEYAALAMKSYIQKQPKTVDVVIEKRLGGNSSERVELIKTIFNNMNIRKLIIINRPKLFYFFSINSIFNFSKIISNLITKRKILKKLDQNKIDLKNYDEILLTNDLISKLFIKNYKTKLKYFFHGWGDIIHLKKSYTLLNFVKRFLTLKILNYYLVSHHKNIKFYNVFNNIYDKKIFNTPYLIDEKIYKKNLFDLTKNVKVKKKITYPFIIPGLFIPKYIHAEDARKSLNYYIKKLNKYIIKYKIKHVILKPKLNYNKKHLKIFKDIFSKSYPNTKICSIFEIFDKYIPLELALLLNKPCYFFSTGTTAEHVVKRLSLTKIKIINAYNFIEQSKYQYFKSKLDLDKEKNSKILFDFIKT